MERILPLKPQDQAARLRHFGGIIFNHLAGFQSAAHLLRGNFTLKHTLNSMDAEEKFGIIHWMIAF